MWSTIIQRWLICWWYKGGPIWGAPIWGGSIGRTARFESMAFAIDNIWSPLRLVLVKCLLLSWEDDYMPVARWLVVLIARCQPIWIVSIVSIVSWKPKALVAQLEDRRSHSRNFTKTPTSWDDDAMLKAYSPPGSIRGLKISLARDFTMKSNFLIFLPRKLTINLGSWDGAEGIYESYPLRLILIRYLLLTWEADCTTVARFVVVTARSQPMWIGWTGGIIREPITFVAR